VKPKSFMLIAGEASGDLLAAEFSLAPIPLQVSPLQGGNYFIRTFSWAFSPSFNISGFQPGRSGQNKGLKAQQVIARAEGPGTPSPQFSPAL